MKKYIYYTPIDLARAIITIIPDINVNTMIDICCGSWNLLKAGKERFPNASLTGVDIDKSSKIHRITNSNFKVMDGREFARKEYKKGKTYDLILSNPPFGAISENERKYNSKEERKNYYSHLINKRYECEMMQANMLLAHDRSVLLFILPCTFVAGNRFQKVRYQIAKDYSVLAVIRLPASTFEGGEINTFAIVLQKGNNTSPAILYEAINNEGTWIFNKLESVWQEQFKQGDWWIKKQFQKGKNVRIIRGNVSSSYFGDKGQEILHCAAKKDGKWLPSIRYYSELIDKKSTIKADKGDVIINRIGRSAGYWCINEDDGVVISDCLLVLKSTTKKMIKVLENNSDSSGRLLVPIRGVTASYVTAEDIKVLFL